MKLALRPIGKNAPPRPRRFDASSSSMTASGSSPRALSSALYPPAARYSEIRVRSRSSAPSSTTASSGTAQLLDDRRHIVRPHRLAVAVVDGDDGPPPAAPGALERAEREPSVVGCLARLHAELLLERLEHLLRADERARDVRADLDQVPPDRLEMEHVVEGRDRLAVRRRHVERVRHVAQRLRGQPPVLLLRHPQPGQHRGARFRVLGSGLLDPLRKRHRSTSPMTVSSDPTIAMKSAISASRMQVAVASRATNDGERN